MSNVLHSKADPNWMTPGSFIACNRACMDGRIGFDPFSSHVANQHVGADAYLTPDMTPDGFDAPWQDDAHINPPGLKVSLAWNKLCLEILSGRVTRAMWVGFSVEQLCILADPNWTVTTDVGGALKVERETDQERWSRGAFYPFDFSVVILRKRISFVREDGTTGSPSHGNYVVGIGCDHALFTKIYGPLGQVIRGPLAMPLE